MVSLKTGISVADCPERNPYLEFLDGPGARNNTEIPCWVSVDAFNPTPNRAALDKLRSLFPAMKEYSDRRFIINLSNRLKPLENTKRQEIKRESVENLVLASAMGFGGPLGVLMLGSIGAWGVRRYPPNQFPLEIKRAIAGSMIWVMASFTWVLISEEGGDIEDALDGEYTLLYIMPPIVFTIAAILWRWANTTSSKG